MIKENADISQVTGKPVVLSPQRICNAASTVPKTSDIQRLIWLTRSLWIRGQIVTQTVSFLERLSDLSLPTLWSTSKTQKMNQTQTAQIWQNGGCTYSEYRTAGGKLNVNNQGLKVPEMWQVLAVILIFAFIYWREKNCQTRGKLGRRRKIWSAAIYFATALLLYYYYSQSIFWRYLYLQSRFSHYACGFSFHFIL